MGYDYEQEEDSTIFKPGGTDLKIKITLNNDELNLSDLFNGDLLVYDAVIAGYSVLPQDIYFEDIDMQLDGIKVPIILTNIDKSDWQYCNSNISFHMDIHGYIRVKSIINDIHFTPEEH